MQFLLTCLCVLLLVPFVLFLRNWYVQIKLKQLSSIKYNALKTLIQKLDSGAPVSDEELAAIAQIPSLRLVLYGVLRAYERTDLFPEEFYTEEKGAQSHLVNWLEFPTELGRPPDEILFLENVTLHLPLQMHYYVFKFRASAPRWADKLGWMLGVCGPYDNHSLPFDVPRKIFSRFNPVDLIKPEVEVLWVHEQMKV
jgi:hypothetical protein